MNGIAPFQKNSMDINYLEEILTHSNSHTGSLQKCQFWSQSWMDKNIADIKIYHQGRITF